MTAMTTVLKEFADNGDSRTYTTAGHTSAKAKIVLNKRRVPSGAQTIAEYTVAVVHGTENSDGLVLPQKVSLTVTARYPIDGDIDTDLAAALVIFRDLVAGDEFEAAVTSQNWLTEEIA